MLREENEAKSESLHHLENELDRRVQTEHDGRLFDQISGDHGREMQATDLIDPRPEVEPSTVAGLPPRTVPAWLAAPRFDAGRREGLFDVRLEKIRRTRTNLPSSCAAVGKVARRERLYICVRACLSCTGQRRRRADWTNKLQNAGRCARCSR